MAELASIGFGEGAGTTAADSSGNSRNVTSVPGWVNSQTGYGKALTTTGNTAAGGRLILPAMSTYTFVMRIRVRAPAGSYGAIFSHGDGTNPQTAHVLITSGMTLTCYWPNGSVFCDAMTVTANQWYHVGFSYDGSQGAWTVDGVATGTPVSSASQNVTASTTGYYVGGSPSFNEDVDIDDLRIFDTALTTSQIAALKDVSLEAPETGGYFLQEDGTSRFILEEGTDLLIKEETPLSATVAFASSSALGVSGTVVAGPATVTMAGSSTLGVAGVETHPATVAMASTSALSVSIAAGIVGKRNLHPAIFSSTLSGTYRLKYPAAVSATNVRLEFPNWVTDVAGTGDSATGNTLTVGPAYIETTGGTLYQILFGGASSSVIASGGSVVSDPVSGWSPVAGTDYWIRVYVVAPGGGRKPRLRTYVNYPAEASRPGTNLANGTGSLSGSGDDSTDMYGPVKVYGDLASGQPQYAIAVVGDSITAGTGDSQNSEANFGHWQRALWGGNRPFEIYGLPGETAAQFITSQGAKRQAVIASHVQYVVNAYGINDMNSDGATLTQMKARCRAVAAIDSTKRWYQQTITPISSSTDGWATTGNQTAGFTATVRGQFNDWVRDGMPESGGVGVATGTVGALRAGQAGHPYTGYIELADYVETSRNSSIWKAGYTADGIHPSATGYSAAASSLDLSPFVDVTATPVSVALTSTSALAVTPLVTHPATVTLASTSGLTVTPLVTHPVTVGFASSSSLAVTPALTVPATVPLASTSSVAVGAGDTIPAAVTLASTSAVAVATTITRAAAVAFASSSTVGVTGMGSIPATLALASTSSLAVAATVIRVGVVGLSSTSTLAVSAGASQSASVTLASSSAVTVAPSLTELAAVLLASTSVLSVAGVGSISGALSVSSSSVLLVSAGAIQSAAVAFTSTSAVTVTPSRTVPAAVTIASSSAVAVVVQGSQSATVAFVQTSTLTALGVVAHAVALAITSTSALTLTPQMTDVGVVPFAGTSSLTLAGRAVLFAAITFAGLSLLNVTGTVSGDVAADTTGDWTATLQPQWTGRLTPARWTATLGG